MKVNPSTPRPDPSTALGTSGLSLPIDKLKALNATEGLSLPAGRQGLTLSGASLPRLKEAGLAFDPSQGRGCAAEWVNRDCEAMDFKK